MAKIRKKKKVGRWRRVQPSPKQNLRPAYISNLLVTTGRAMAIFEREGKLFIASFPPSQKAPVQALDCARHAVSIPLSYCTGVIAENSAAKPGQPKAIVFHVPPRQRAHEHRAPFAYAEKIVPALLNAMPLPTRVEIIGGYGKGKCPEIQLIERDLLKNKIKPIINKKTLGGIDKKRFVQLRPQEGKKTVFDYSQKYVLSDRERLTRRGLAMGLSGKALHQYVAEQLAGVRQTIAEVTRADGEKIYR